MVSVSWDGSNGDTMLSMDVQRLKNDNNFDNLYFSNKKAILKDDSLLRKQSTKPVMPRNTRARGRDRSTTKLREEMEKLGEYY